MRAQLSFRLLPVLLLCLVAPSASASQDDIDAEVNRYITTLKGSDYAEQRQVMAKLEWAGHSSTDLYDVIAAELSSRKDTKQADEAKQASWYAKSLSTSGNDKYLSLLSDVAVNAKAKRIRKFAERGPARTEKYRAWNAIISSGLIAAPTGRLEQTRVANMLQTDNMELLKIGAKRVYHEFSTDQELVAIAKQRLSTEWDKVNPENDHQLDSVAWLIRAIGQAGDSSSKALLDDIEANSKIKKIRKYAKKVRKKLI